MEAGVVESMKRSVKKIFVWACTFFLSELVSMLPHAVALNMLFKILMAELIPILASFPRS